MAIYSFIKSIYEWTTWNQTLTHSKYIDGFFNNDSTSRMVK